ncbi:MAG: hypothetical protein IPK42_10595 [Betaproteobacteria bacterium]|nr:hypothetical protein [Betaproteobacteria bacterium]
MTPTQRAAALRLADSLEWLLRNCADPDSYPMSMSKEAATLLRELLATPVVNQQMTTDPAEPVQEPSPLAGTMAEQFLQVVAGIWHDHPDYSIRQTLDALNATFPAEPVAAELPAPQLLVESAQGFVEGWTRSQVRSAINLALLKRRYAAPQQPMRCPEDGGACGAGGYCRPEPQQRKPLTDDEALALIRATPQEDVTQEGWIRRQRLSWVRAIEEAVWKNI